MSLPPRAVRLQTRPSSPTFSNFMREVEWHLFQIERLLVPDAKLTLLIRVPDDAEYDVVFTKDEYDSLIEMLTRCKSMDVMKQGEGSL